MPTISKEKYRLHDEEAKKRDWHYTRGGFLKITTYTSKDKKIGGFKIKLPDYMEGPLGYSFVRGFSQDEVDKKFRDAILEYNIRIASKRKVITYSLLANVDKVIEGKRFHKEQLKLYSKSKYSTGLALWYAVCWETKTERGNSKYYDDEGHEVSTPSYGVPFEVLEYSPEREDFFKALSESIALMVYNADSFLKQKDKLLELIESNRALPFFVEANIEEKK
jgi:hypothetical protein